MVRYITKTRPIIEHGFSESCMNLSDPSVFPKNCSLGEENETKPELPQLLLLLYVPIILVTFYLFQKYKKNFLLLLYVPIILVTSLINLTPIKHS